MSDFINKVSIREILCGANVTYVLDDTISIQATEYKVMQNQNVNCLVKCMRMKYNGQESLYYLTAGLKSFRTKFLSAAPDEAANLTLALLRSLVELKGVGFLSCVNLEGALHKIYVDQRTNQVFFVYFPIDRHFYADELTFESELRGNLVRQIDELPVSSEKLIKLRQLLINSTMTLEGIVGSGGEKRKSEEKKQNQSEITVAKKQQMVLTAVNSPESIQIVVSKDEFRIGKSPDADGTVSFNKYIGRLHCVIKHNDSGFSAIDLNSKNGTFINGSRLTSQQPYRLKAGDILRLANTDFRVSIG